MNAHLEQLYGEAWRATAKREGHLKKLPPSVLTTEDRVQKYGHVTAERNDLIMDALRKAKPGRKFNATRLKEAFGLDMSSTSISRGLLHLWSLGLVERRKVIAAGTGKVRHSVYWLKEECK